MGHNIYYIEDSSKHFEELYKELSNTKLNLFPSLKNWENEVQLIRLYLQNQNNQNKQALIELFHKYDIDLFIIDISLFHLDSGGTMIYENIFEKNEEFKDKCIIFLTLPESHRLVYSAKNIQIEHKSKNRDKSIDFKHTADKVYVKIKEMLNIKDTFEDVVDDLL